MHFSVDSSSDGGSLHGEVSLAQHDHNDSTVDGWCMRPMARDWSTLAVATCMSPAGREAFTKITGSQIFSLKFCPPRWVENACVANRVLLVLGNVNEYVDTITRQAKVYTVPNNRSFNTIKTNKSLCLFQQMGRSRTPKCWTDHPRKSSSGTSCAYLQGHPLFHLGALGAQCGNSLRASGVTAPPQPVRSK